MDQVRVVLDCDTANEVDDQFAIAHALGLPEGTLDVRGVISVHNTTAHGPTSRDMYQEEAERVVALCAGDVPCIPGAERPMESMDEPVPSAGLEFLVEEARLSPLTIVATGPATDIASLFLAAPESLGERARNLARRVRGRSHLQGLAQQDGRAERQGRHLGLANVAGSTPGSLAHPHVARAGEDTGGSSPIRRRVARARTACRIVPGRDPAASGRRVRGPARKGTVGSGLRRRRRRSRSHNLGITGRPERRRGGRARFHTAGTGNRSRHGPRRTTNTRRTYGRSSTPP